MKDYLHRYKFLHDILLAKVFNKILHEQLKNETRLIIPIPMHPENLRLRTFAHIDELLKAANIPFAHHLIKLSTEQQSLKTREERLQTPQLFEVINPAAIKNKSLLIVDDIYTTGTTLNHAKKAMSKPICKPSCNTTANFKVNTLKSLQLKNKKSRASLG